MCQLHNRHLRVIRHLAGQHRTWSNNLNREAIHTKLRKRFHLAYRARIYISDCVIIEIRQEIERLEADRTASRKKEDNQLKLTAFYMSSTCSHSKKLDSDTDSESTSSSSTNRNGFG